MDYIPSERHNLSGTFRWNRDNVDRPDAAISLPPSRRCRTKTGRTYFRRLRWSVSANLTNELRGGGNLTTAPFDVSGSTPAFLLSGTLMTNPSNVPAAGPEIQRLQSPGQRQLDTRQALHHLWRGDATGSHRAVRLWRHRPNLLPRTLFEWRAIRLRSRRYSWRECHGHQYGQLPASHHRGIIGLGVLRRSVRLADLQHHQPDVGLRSRAPQRQHLSFNDYAGYASDSWKAVRNLTVNLGVRWDYSASLRRQTIC